MGTRKLSILLIIYTALLALDGKSQGLNINNFSSLIMAHEEHVIGSSIPYGACVLSSGTIIETQNKITKIKENNPECLIFLDGQLLELPDPDLAFLIKSRVQRRLFLSSLSSLLDSIGIDFIIRKNLSLDTSCRSFIRKEQIDIFSNRNIRFIEWSDENTSSDYWGFIKSIKPGEISLGLNTRESTKLSIALLPAYLKFDEKSLSRTLRAHNYLFAENPKQLFEEFTKSKLFAEQTLLDKIQINNSILKSKRNLNHQQLETIDYQGIEIFGRSSHILMDNTRLPLALSKTRNVSIVQIGNTELSELRNHLIFYAPTTIKRYSDDLTGIHSYLSKVKDNQLILIIEKELYPNFDARLISVIMELQKSNNSVVILSHQNQNLQSDIEPDVLSFDLSHGSQKALAEVLFGALSIKNSLPYNFRDSQCGYGLLVKEQDLLSYGDPEEVGIATSELRKIEEIVFEAIDKKATPGCQILIAKGQKIIWEKAYGYQDYTKQRKVEPHHLYDLASLTKILSTTQLLMSNWEKTQFPLDDQIGSLLPELSGEIASVKIRDLLTHRSGLQAFMPIFDLMSEEDLNNRFHQLYCEHEDDEYCIKVAEDLYLRKDFVDSIWLNITQLDPKRKRYRYSDVNFNMLKRLLERQNGEDLYSSLLDKLINPLNLQSLCFRPADCFPLELIVPTQEDSSWRNQLLHGYVHDYATALMGGVSGSAGLFSNTRDLAIISQMWLNKGSYGDQRLLEKETVNRFTAKQTYSHRGLGFNKPHPNGRSSGIAESASSSTFGHTGFTGTCMWIDPEEDLIFIFLSNRVHPDESNNILQKRKIRERIHEQVYQSLNSHQIN